MSDSLDPLQPQNTFQQSSRAFSSNTNYKKQFSFNKHTANNLHLQSSNRDHYSCNSKYSSLESDLKKLENNDLIDLLIEEIQENDCNKNLMFKKDNQLSKLRQEIKQLQMMLEKKRTAISMLCQTQSKNLNLIQKLESRLRNQSQTLKQSLYEKKYHQLSKYMDQYINNINEAQQEFKKNYNLLKGQNKRLYAQVQNTTSTITQLQKRNYMITHKLQKYQKIMQEITQTQRQLHDELEYLARENQNLKKQILRINVQNQQLKRQLDNCYQNLKMTDRIQAQSQHQISSQLDFIREKLYQNQTISKDIIGKYQVKQAQFQKMLRQKQQLQQLNLKNTQKNKELQVQNKQYQIQNNILKNKVQSYIKEIQSLQKSVRKLKVQEESLVQEYSIERKQKQVIKSELLSLTQQVKFMEDTYKRQLENSQKIRQQLQKFWKNKQRREAKYSNINNQNSNYQNSQKEVLKQISLSQVKQNGNQSGVSQSTYDYTESKISKQGKSNRCSKQNHLQQ